MEDISVRTWWLVFSLIALMIWWPQKYAVLVIGVLTIVSLIYDKLCYNR